MNKRHSSLSLKLLKEICTATVHGQYWMMSYIRSSMTPFARGQRERIPRNVRYLIGSLNLPGILIPDTSPLLLVVTVDTSAIGKIHG